MPVDEVLHPALRIVVAAVLAAAVGYERQSAGKHAGLRTHMIVAMAATLFISMVDVIVRRYAPLGEGMRIDPTRAIEAVATGIGFLGAGIIFITRDRARVRGVTTAATIWATAALGVAVGLEAYLVAAVTTILLVLVLRGLNRWDSDDPPIADREEPRGG
jgi:putative Mg2+ transporter-C (MgtC) family protein